MFLYNLTLQRATGISFAIHGNFSGNFLLPLPVLARGFLDSTRKKMCFTVCFSTFGVFMLVHYHLLLGVT